MYSFKSGIKPVYVKDVGIFSVPVINDSSYDKEEIDFNDYEYLKRPLLSKKEKDEVSKKFGPIPDPIQIDTYIGVRNFRLQQNMDKKRKEYLIDKLAIAIHANKRIVHQTYYFNDHEEMERSYKTLFEINRTNRYLAVLVNPISGKKKSRTYFRDILLPMLQIAEIEHEMILTTSETFVEEWVNNLDVDTTPYTDFILIGGDGLFSQMINAIFKHPQKDKLLKMPIGVMPCGSQNAISCDLGGKNPYLAAAKIVRGQTVQADAMKITFEESKNVIYGTSLLWGFPSHVVSQSRNWRWLFGSARYGICGFRNFMCNWPFVRYQCSIDYKYDSNVYESVKSCNKQSITDEESKEFARSSDLNFDINNSPKSSDCEVNEDIPFVKIAKQSEWRTLSVSDFFFFVVVQYWRKYLCNILNNKLYYKKLLKDKSNEFFW